MYGRIHSALPFVHTHHKLLRGVSLAGTPFFNSSDYGTTTNQDREKGWSNYV